MNYFNYAIKCIIRNIIYKLMKPKTLIIIVVSLIIIFLLSQYTSVFGWEGNSTYTDKNTTIIIQYDSINQDILNRLNYYDKDNNMYVDFVNTLQNNNYSYYAYYGASDGSSMISQTYYNTQEIYIKFYDNEIKTLSGTVYDTYQGMTTNIALMTGGIADTYVFNGNTLVNISDTSSFYIPYCLINYKSPVLYSLLNDTSSSQTDSIVGAINQQTNTIQQQTNTIQEQTEAMTNTTFDENSVDIDTSSADVDNSTESGLFTTIFTNFNNSIQNENVEYITIPFPNNIGSLTIPSNLVSSRLGALSTLVSAFWLYLFGFYAFKFVNNLLIKIKDGSILDGYTSTEVITNDMM